MKQQCAVIGAGAWGTALALVLCRSNGTSLIYSRNIRVVEDINTHHKNESYLPSVLLPASVRATFSLAETLSAEALVLAVPSQYIRNTCLMLKELALPASTLLVLCCKGIEVATLKLMNEIVAEILPMNPVAVLSGPNFADEIAAGLPAATTIACADKTRGAQLVQYFGHSSFRPYYTDDVAGTQIGGAVKNVLAIASGIVTGRKLGENAKAALITRGLAEMVRLGLAKGGKMETLMGLSGVGDLLLTASSSKSRNMSLGIALGEGKTLEEILGNRHTVAEGVASADSVIKLAASLQVEMPICSAVADILYHDLAIDDAIMRLLQRPLTKEGS